MWIEREISSELTELARRHPVLVLTGPRQVGKTSLLERLFTGYRYVTLDLVSNAEMAESRPAAALWYWRNQSGDEVDLLIEHNALLYPIECKLAERRGGHATRGIKRLRQLYGDGVTRAFVACSTETPFDIAPGITAVNGWQTWALDD